MLYEPDPDLAEFIHRLPKTETHLHLEGALAYETVRSLAPEELEEQPQFLGRDFRFESFDHFESLLIPLAIRWFTSAERYHEAATLVFQNLLNQNVRYVETSFHLGIIEFTGIPGKEIVHAIRTAAPAGLEVRIYAGMLRNHYTPEMKPVIDDLGNWSELDGIDLHGPESLPREDWIPEVWSRAREAGKKTKVHAGEFGGPENVRDAVERIGVTRIQHGVRAIEDPEVVRLLAERDVTLDLCPISNVKLGVVPSMADHPIQALIEAGIRCTVSTDDPMVFGNTLTDEYAALAEDLGFSRADLAKVARAGFETADLPAASKQKAFEELDAAVS